MFPLVDCCLNGLLKQFRSKTVFCDVTPPPPPLPTRLLPSVYHFRFTNNGLILFWGKQIDAKNMIMSDVNPWKIHGKLTDRRGVVSVKTL